MRNNLAQLGFKAFVINLNSRPDRMANVDFQRHLIPVELERFTAITPSDIDLAVQKFVKPAVAACWASHKAIYSHMAKHGIKYALILEDDFKIKSTNFDRILSFMVENSVGVLQIGFLRGTFGRKIDLVGRNFFHCVLHIISRIYKVFPFLSKLKSSELVAEAASGSFNYVSNDFRFGTHCYLINLETAEAILELNDPQFLAADDFFVALSKMKSIKIYRTLLSRASQIESESSILNYSNRESE